MSPKGWETTSSRIDPMRRTQEPKEESSAMAETEDPRTRSHPYISEINCPRKCPHLSLRNGTQDRVPVLGRGQLSKEQSQLSRIPQGAPRTSPNPQCWESAQGKVLSRHGWATAPKGEVRPSLRAPLERHPVGCDSTNAKSSQNGEQRSH